MRAWTVSLVLAVAILVVFVAALAVGDYRIAPGDVVATLLGNAPHRADVVVLRLRLPRAVLAVLTGFAFGLAGVIFQRLLRNPLASPDVIGISAGASLAAVVDIVLIGAAVWAAALIGGLVTAVLIYLLAWQRGVNGYRLALIGVGVSAALSSVTSYLLTKAQVTVAQEAFAWLTGSLYGRTWEQVRPLLFGALVLVPVLFGLFSRLEILVLGDDTARALGLDVERTRLMLLLGAAALVCLATAAAGPIAFVAFVSGPIAERLCRHDRRLLLPAALVGVLLTLSADFAAQHLLGVQLPVGVVTGVIGAPYLLWLLARADRA